MRIRLLLLVLLIPIFGLSQIKDISIIANNRFQWNTTSIQNNLTKQNGRHQNYLLSLRGNLFLPQIMSFNLKSDIRKRNINETPNTNITYYDFTSRWFDGVKFLGHKIPVTYKKAKVAVTNNTNIYTQDTKAYGVFLIKSRFLPNIRYDTSIHDIVYLDTTTASRSHKTTTINISNVAKTTPTGYNMTYSKNIDNNNYRETLLGNAYATIYDKVKLNWVCNSSNTATTAYTNNSIFVGMGRMQGDIHYNKKNIRTKASYKLESSIKFRGEQSNTHFNYINDEVFENKIVKITHNLRRQKEFLTIPIHISVTGSLGRGVYRGRKSSAYTNAITLSGQRHVLGFNLSISGRLSKTSINNTDNSTNRVVLTKVLKRIKISGIYSGSQNTMNNVRRKNNTKQVIIEGNLFNTVGVRTDYKYQNTTESCNWSLSTRTSKIFGSILADKNTSANKYTLGASIIRKIGNWTVSLNTNKIVNKSRETTQTYIDVARVFK